ncbi:hypothetical protein AAF712_012653, partial [Marasmius tenuissimus]
MNHVQQPAPDFLTLLWVLYQTILLWYKGVTANTTQSINPIEVIPNHIQPPMTQEPKIDLPPPAKKDTIPVPGKMDRETMKRKGLCFKCQKPGHKFFDCPEEGDKEKEKPDVQRMIQEDRNGLLKNLLDQDPEKTPRD